MTVFKIELGRPVRSAEEAGARPGNFVTLPTQEVDRSGTITIPFAGQVTAAWGGHCPEIQRDIEKRIANRAIEPQVLVTLPERNASEVTVVGDIVASANKFKIRPGGERVLDIISKAGGLKYPGYEAFVTLQRGKKMTTVYFPTLVNDPNENIFVAPGDTLYVYRLQQKFVAVGALGSSGQTSGLTGQFAFEQERLSLNEAVARAGGLLDFRANPGQVFLYRLEYREYARGAESRSQAVSARSEAHPDHLSGQLPRSVELLLRAGIPHASQGHHLRLQCGCRRSDQVPGVSPAVHVDQLGIRNRRSDHT